MEWAEKKMMTCAGERWNDIAVWREKGPPEYRYCGLC